ncbi:Nitrogen permease regulator 2 [Mactra antiquata]
MCICQLLNAAYGINITVKVGIILIESIAEPFDLPRVGPALSIAFEHIQEDFGITFEPVYRNYSGRCPWEPPLGILSELYYYENIEALIGPACSQGVESSARLAQYLKLPMVSGLGDLALRQYPTDMFKTLTKLSYNIQKISYSLSAIMSQYRWKHTAILYDNSYILWRVIGVNLAIDFRRTDSLERPYDIPFDPLKSTNNSYSNFLLEAKQRARVFIFVCDAATFREFMYEAYKLGLANGEYVFITIELFESEWFGLYRQFLRGDDKDYGVTKSYETVLIVTLTQPRKDDPEFIKFSDEVKRRALIQYNYTFGPEEEVNYFITAFYDSALYLANVYNITYHRNADLKDGMAIAQTLWNNSFQGITGPVAIDETGERVADFDLLDMISPVHKQFQVDVEQVFSEVGVCRGHTIAIRKLRQKYCYISKKIEIEFHEMTKLVHPNLAKFVGACLQPDNMKLLIEYCPRGSLQDILHNDSISLDWNIRFSLIHDIIKGMLYLHGSPVQAHGRLTSTNCVIDSRFMLKLTDYGLHEMFARERQEEKVSHDLICKKLLWTAPEHLRNLDATYGVNYSQPGDVYSFGIILQEIITRNEPFENNNLSYHEIITQLIDEGGAILRPHVDEDDGQPAILSLMRHCWSEEAFERPTFSAVNQTLKQMRAGKTSNIMDNLLQRMTQYADNLETLAAERTSQYLEEKQRVEQLLYRLLPKSVASQLSKGNMVTPELYQCVSIYFSDIVGFTALAAVSTPIQVVDLLNDLFTKFDEAIAKFDVYKVETIGDAYMVVSGLPERNGNKHIAEISGMGLFIINIVSNFNIRHRPDDKLRIRAGIHSGPVVAGVVGKTMPRFCLFGDTVNTASRMESNSLPQQIQMTKSAKMLLDNFPQFMTQERGKLDIKGKGTMTTFWLVENKCTSYKEILITDNTHVQAPGTNSST